MSGFTKLSARALAVWLVIIAVESIHGVLRTVFLAPAFGDARARQISVFTGAGLILAIALLFIRWLRAETNLQLLGIGIFWTLLTVIFEIVLGRYAMGMSWQRIEAEYDLSSGSLMPLGLLFMIFAPMIAERLRAPASK